MLGYKLVCLLCAIRMAILLYLNIMAKDLNIMTKVWKKYRISLHRLRRSSL